MENLEKQHRDEKDIDKDKAAGKDPTNKFDPAAIMAKKQAEEEEKA